VLLISATVCRRCAVVISKDFSCPIFTEDQARCINKFLNIQNHIQAYTALNWGIFPNSKQWSLHDFWSYTMQSAHDCSGPIYHSGLNACENSSNEATNPWNKYRHSAYDNVYCYCINPCIYEVECDWSQNNSPLYFVVLLILASHHIIGILITHRVLCSSFQVFINGPFRCAQLICVDFIVYVPTLFIEGSLLNTTVWSTNFYTDRWTWHASVIENGTEGKGSLNFPRDSCPITDPCFFLSAYLRRVKVVVRYEDTSLGWT
jgi:hypothetical protein